MSYKFLIMKTGNEIHNLAKELWPLNRSLTGSGNRSTLKIIKQKHLNSLKIKSVLSRKKIFDWVVPDEWHVYDAYIITPDGKRICDFKKNNLHLMGYSQSINERMTLKELKNYLYSDPKQPKAIPYITSYYEKKWGFCISHNEKKKLKSGLYKAYIKAKQFKGVMNYGELIIKGKSKKEVFLSTYICHPSMANNELSGISVLTFLAKWLVSQRKNKYTYRIVFLPETIGSLAYINLNKKKLISNTVAGFNLTCIGDDRSYSYLPSRDGNTLSDIVAKHVLKWTDKNYKKYTRYHRGSDERQYCSPGINLPIATICRTKYREYAEYHTSADNLTDVVTPKGLYGGFKAIKRTIQAIEVKYNPKSKIVGEPFLRKRYLNKQPLFLAEESRTLLNLHSYCDGKLSLIEIAEILDIPIWDLVPFKDELIRQNLISGE